MDEGSKKYLDKKYPILEYKISDKYPYLYIWDLIFWNTFDQAWAPGSRTIADPATMGMGWGVLVSGLLRNSLSLLHPRLKTNSTRQHCNAEKSLRVSWERTHSWWFHWSDRDYFASYGLDLEPQTWLSLFLYNCMFLPCIMIIMDYPWSPAPPVNLIRAIVWTQKEGHLVEHLQLPLPIPVKKNTTPSNNPLPLIAPSYGSGFTSYFFTPKGMPTYHI